MSTFPLSLPRVLAWSERLPELLLSSAYGGSAARRSEVNDETGTAEARDECRAAMRQVLDVQIIPRLLQVTRSGPAAVAAPAALAPSAAEVEAFARVCATGDREACNAFVDRLRAAGLQPESVLEELVAPAARHLGRQWEDDTLDFSAVTIGLVRLHEVIHALGYEVHDGPQVSGPVRRVMLASAPGSQHVLGLSIVSEFFRKAGWQVVLEVSPSAEELARAVRNEWFDLLGLSVALDSQLDGLGALVGRLRKASRSPLPPVMLGGPVFFQRPLLAAQFGAQAICLDARESISLANALAAR